ncbi:hypothetical protein [Methylocystis heyeri]|uniref:Uncharacterized protein n=1 Tax=Methylocystis heyeri TaxID=391905 RepID=A0A6B8KIJ2_9HYPH|nr:hypothetical protein [Methylocystis heyeri]QGM46715.1 hypothetical protein H2LOC_013995 [Methylocystis heyeri]
MCSSTTAASSPSCPIGAPEIAKMHEARLVQGIEVMKFLVVHGEAFKRFLEEQKAKGATP